MVPQARVKSLAYLGSFFMMEHARQNGCDDCLSTNSDGWLLETACANIFWIHDNTLYTPDRDLHLYTGVTIAVFQRAAQDALGMNVREVRCKLEDIPKDAHVFRCNATLGAIPIIKIGDLNFSRNEDLETSLTNAHNTLAQENSLSFH